MQTHTQQPTLKYKPITRILQQPETTYTSKQFKCQWWPSSSTFFNAQFLFLDVCTSEYIIRTHLLLIIQVLYKPTYNTYGHFNFQVIIFLSGFAS